MESYTGAEGGEVQVVHQGQEAGQEEDAEKYVWAAVDSGLKLVPGVIALVLVLVTVLLLAQAAALVLEQCRDGS